MPDDKADKADKAEGPGRNPFHGVSFSAEFVTGQNNQLLCPLTRRVYRGRWDPTAIKNRVPDDRFASFPTVPGHVLVFSGATRLVTVKDPLAERPLAGVLKQAQAAVVAMNWPKPDPTPERVYKGLPDGRLKEWCYWVRRWLDAGQVAVLSGTVPEMAEVERLPGQIERNLFDSSAKRERFPAESPEYVPVAAARAMGDG